MPARGTPRALRPTPEMLLRVVLCAAAVVVCYRLDWTWLGFLTSEVVLRWVHLLGFDGERISPIVIAWRGEQFAFGIACTYADVWFGAIPLLWRRDLGVGRNLGAQVLFAAGLLGFNLIRQAATALVFAAGVPWSVTDAVSGGLGYFAVWAFLVAWLERSPTAARPAMPAIRSRTAATAPLVVP